jgi:hypothetical protein
MKSWIIGIVRTLLLLIFCDSLILALLLIDSYGFIVSLISVLSFLSLIWIFRKGRVRGSLWSRGFSVLMTLTLILISFWGIAILVGEYNMPTTPAVEYISFFFIFFMLYLFYCDPIFNKNCALYTDRIVILYVG